MGGGGEKAGKGGGGDEDPESGAPLLGSGGSQHGDGAVAAASGPGAGGGARARGLLETALPPHILSSARSAVNGGAGRNVNVFGFSIPAPAALLGTLASLLLAGPAGAFFVCIILALSHLAFSEGTSGSSLGSNARRGGDGRGGRPHRGGPNIRGMRDLPRDPRPS